MKHKSVLAVVLAFFGFGANAQSDSLLGRGCNCSKTAGDRFSEKGEYYISWGYNKDWYSKTDLHFFDASGDYDFTLHNMKAHDHPQWKDIFRVQLSIPQYGYRMGYFFPASAWGVELNFDHAKYIVTDYQTVRLTGRIGDNSFNQDTLVDPDKFMHLEHTDGANFLMANAMRRWQLYQSPGKRLQFSAIVKAGAGFVIPRSDVTLWGERNNHCFHIAGELAGIETGFRLSYRLGPLRLFFDPGLKGSYASFNKVLGIGDGLVSHSFGTFSVLLHGGVSIPLGSKL